MILIRHDTNRGYGAALRTGFEAARFPLVAFTDADCQFDLRELVRLAKATESCDVAVGYRVDRKDTRRRCFYSRGYNLLVRTILGTGVRDVDCALKVFRRESLAVILPDARGFFVNTEMLTRARWLGLTVTEHPVSHRPRLGGESKVSLVEIPKTFSKLVGFWWTNVVRGTEPMPRPSRVQSWRVPVTASNEVAPPASLPRLDFERDHLVEPLERHPVSV